MSLEAPALTDTPASPPPETATPPAPAGDGSVPPANKPAKPDGLPESLSAFWNDDTGFDYTRLGETAASYATLKADADARAAQVPENIADYEIALPEGFDVPEGMSFEALADHPLGNELREFAKSANLTRDQFKGIVALDAKRQIAERQQLVEASKNELGKLGTKGQQRIDAVVAWTKATAGDDKAGALLPMMFTAKQIEAFEALMTAAKAAGPTTPPPANPNPPEAPKPMEQRWYPQKAS